MAVDANGKLRLMFISRGETSLPGVVRDVSGLPFDELAEEGEILVIGHDVRGTADFALGDEHFQMGHDLVFELLAERERVRSNRWSKNEWSERGEDCRGRRRVRRVLKGTDRRRT